MNNSSKVFAAFIAAALVLLVLGPSAMSGGLPLHAPSHKALSITASLLIAGGLFLEGWKTNRERLHLDSPRALQAIVCFCLTAAVCKLAVVGIELGAGSHIV